MSDWAIVALAAIAAAFLFGLIWLGSRQGPEAPPTRQKVHTPMWHYRGYMPTEYKAPPPPPKTPGGIGKPRNVQEEA